MLAFACTEPPPSSEVIAPPDGAEQPAGSGALLDEDEACSRLAEAVSSAIDRLGCDRSGLACPEAIRPAGACPTFAYDEGSVTACVERLGAYESCSDFEARPCITTAVPAAGRCITPSGQGGAGGASNEGGAGGSD